MEKVEISKYRSISDAKLEPCGDFNVLIGRNNSGKSNILASIEAFFSSIRPEAINTSPPIGDEIDLFQKDSRQQIQIRATFRPTATEIQELLADISDERPQVKTLLEEMRPDLRLFVCIAFNSTPKKFAYVQKIELLSTGTDSRTLLEVDEKAAKDLHEIVEGMERSDASKASLTKFLEVFDSDDYTLTKRNRARDTASGPPIEYYLRRSGETDNTLMAEVTRAFHSSDSYESFITNVGQLSQAAESRKEALSKQPISSSIKTFTGEEHIVPRHVKQLLARLKSTKILHFRERRAPIGSEEAKRLLSLKIKRGGTGVLARIQSTIDELLGVKVDAFEGPINARGQATAELDVDQFLIQANGSGIREALRLILDTEFSEPDLLLVEEPEIHLHPALETSIMSYLRELSLQRQVFITTHSTNFLDTGNFENVFLVQKDESTKLSPLSLAEAEKKLPTELGIRLSSLFMYDQIIFVEGPSDEQIVREFARTLNVNLGQLNVGFIQMGGVRNLGHYAAAEIVSFLTKRRVRLYFLVDSDESQSVHFQRLREEFNQNAHIHVLKKREIENYLLSPAANIRHLIARKKAAGEYNFAAPEKDAFRTLQEEAAEALKPLAIWKRIVASASRPFYPKTNRSYLPAKLDDMRDCAKSMLQAVRNETDRLIIEVDQMCNEAASTVDGDWQNGKMDIVPGSAILDETYKKFGFRYDKMRDGIGIASQMYQEEIHVELRDFVSLLVRKQEAGR